MSSHKSVKGEKKILLKKGDIDMRSFRESSKKVKENATHAKLDSEKRSVKSSNKVHPGPFEDADRSSSPENLHLDAISEESDGNDFADD